eukprot:358486-Chlamydomonas_euryale.AAC.6
MMRRTMCDTWSLPYIVNLRRLPEEAACNLAVQDGRVRKLRRSADAMTQAQAEQGSAVRSHVRAPCRTRGFVLHELHDQRGGASEWDNDGRHVRKMTYVTLKRHQQRRGSSSSDGSASSPDAPKQRPAGRR